MSMQTRKFETSLSLSFILLSAFWIVIRLPSLSGIFVDADGGHQLAGATQILHGEIPFVDFDVTYGPLTFYASAFAQLIFNQRVIGEFILNLIGYTIAYTLLSIMIYRITGNLWITLLFGVFALAAIPRLYKYYLVLGPVLTLWTAWNYIEKPNWKNMLLMALTITLTGLFRSDFGAYCAIAGALTVFVHPSFKEGGFKRTFILLGETFLFALPWLLFLFIKGGLANYFRDMFIGGINAAAGMSLPFPFFRFDQSILSSGNLIVMALLFFLCFPFLFLLFLAFRWNSLSDLENKKLLVTTVLYSFSLLQVSHRIDYPHLLQTIPLAFLLGGWVFNKLWNEFWVNKRGNIFYLISLVTMLIFVSLPVSLINQSAWPQIDIQSVPDKIRKYSLPNDQLLSQNPKQGQAEVEMMQYISRCTTGSQQLVVIPNLPTFYFYTNRAFGGGQMLIAPGYFSAETDQERMIATMSRQDIPLIVYQPNVAYDGLAEREFKAVAPKVFAYIEENYTSVIKDGLSILMLRNDLKIEQRAEKLSGFSCPQP